MLLTTSEISTRYDKGLGYLSNITFNKFLKNQYRVQFKSTSYDKRLLMLLYALDSWDNRTGAVNWLTEQQMSAVLDQIAYAHRDPLTAMCSTSGPGDCKCSGNGFAFSVADTQSVHLSIINGILTADVKISPESGNGVSIHARGLYASGSGGSGGGKIYFTGNDFNTGTNQYDNAALAGLTEFVVWHRGLGFLLYDFTNPSNPDNEFEILPGGGINITIPGFDVHDGNNYFYIIY